MSQVPTDVSTTTPGDSNVEEGSVATKNNVWDRVTLPSFKEAKKFYGEPYNGGKMIESEGWETRMKPVPGGYHTHSTKATYLDGRPGLAIVDCFSGQNGKTEASYDHQGYGTPAEGGVDSRLARYESNTATGTEGIYQPYDEACSTKVVMSDWELGGVPFNPVPPKKDKWGAKEVSHVQSEQLEASKQDSDAEEE